jgi:hypothetical protein
VNNHTPNDDSSDQSPELAALRAEVARVLSTDTPDPAILTAALERVEDMLSSAREELASVLRDVVEQLGIREPDRGPAHFAEAWSLLRRRNLLPW